MNFFKIIPKPRNTPDKNVMIDLTVIDHYCVTRAHPRLFRQTVEGLVRRMPTRMGEIESIVSGVTKSIQIAGKVKKEDPSTHGRQEIHTKALQDGIDRLEALQPVAPIPEETQQALEARKSAREMAIKEDADRFKIFRGVQLEVPSPQQQHVNIVYNMEDPDETAIPIPRYNPTCLDVRRYLQTSGIAALPDVWAGYKDTGLRKHGHVELLWRLLPGKAEVRGHCLKFVERASGDNISAKGQYIVALKFMTNEEKALPVPLGACLFGAVKLYDRDFFHGVLIADIAGLGRPCCGLGCANLQAHLMKLWSKSLVTHAVMIRDGDDVLTKSFDDGIFSPLTNDLCLHVVNE